MAMSETDSTVPVLAPGVTSRSITDRISSIPLTSPRRTPRGWLLAFGITLLLVMGLLTGVTYLFVQGIGIWGVNVPVGWGFDILNFVWWIGIGHAGTLISAILLLFRQQWRTSINRFAEAITLFAVAQAAMFPILHLGRPWFFYWLIPYPNTMGVWPQFRSPIICDFFALTAYGTVSLLFWFMGLIPDLATMRDKTRSRVLRIVYGMAAMGWRGSARHWQRFQKAYFLIAALATPLVVSVHTIVSFDFAVGIVPGWHSTIFPPYFVAGALYSGFAMVLTVTILLRRFYRLQDFVTMRHIDNMAKIMLASGLVVAYGYFSEAFITAYGGNPYEQFALVNRATGPYAPLFWLMLFCNAGVLQLLWFRRVRTSLPVLFVASLLINLGMWLERFVIIPASLHRDYLPSAWGFYTPTIWDWVTLAGTIGLFAFLLLMFIRVLPMISMSEMRELAAEMPASGSEAARAPAAGRE